MPGLSDRTLLAFLANVLDEGARKEVEDALATEAGAQVRLSALSAELSAPRHRRWRIPAAGLGSLRIGRPVAQVVLGKESIAPGAVFEVPLLGAPQDAIVVLLHCSEEGWHVLFPTHEAEVLPVHALPEAEPGTRRLPIRSENTAGVQRWAVLLTSEQQVSNGLSLGWRDLEQALAEGSVLVESFDVRVG